MSLEYCEVNSVGAKQHLDVKVAVPVAIASEAANWGVR